jgi:hypothetical protein
MMKKIKKIKTLFKRMEPSFFLTITTGGAYGLTDLHIRHVILTVKN